MVPGNHVIIESIESLYPWYGHGKSKGEANFEHPSSRPFLIGFSAHDKATLTRNICSHAKIADNFYLADLAYTLNSRETNSLKEPSRWLGRAAKPKTLPFRHSNMVLLAKPHRKIGLIFMGHGAQWAGMAVEAIELFPSYLDTIKALDEILQTIIAPSWSTEESPLDLLNLMRWSATEISQPVCTAIQIAIVDLVESWDVTPLATVGHSSGEVGH